LLQWVAKMKRALKWVGILIAGFILIQFIPYGRDHSNPPIIAEPKWDSQQTGALAHRACFDCHSNETTWPWYSNIAPVSWLVMRDVEEGRTVINFSEWGANPRLRTEHGSRGTVGQAVGEAVVSGEMPPMQYLVMHPNADLSQAERQQLAQGFRNTLGDASDVAQK
jgi:hypothetical protein